MNEYEFFQTDLSKKTIVKWSFMIIASSCQWHTNMKRIIISMYFKLNRTIVPITAEVYWLSLMVSSKWKWSIIWFTNMVQRIYISWHNVWLYNNLSEKWVKKVGHGHQGMGWNVEVKFMMDWCLPECHPYTVDNIMAQVGGYIGLYSPQC